MYTYLGICVHEVNQMMMQDIYTEERTIDNLQLTQIITGATSFENSINCQGD